MPLTSQMSFRVVGLGSLAVEEHAAYITNMSFRVVGLGSLAVEEHAAYITNEL